MFFIRHGETEWNRKHIAMGSTNCPLNKKGILQAQSAAKLLKKESQISSIITSPLLRTVETAEIIQKELHCPLIYLNNLREMNLGIMEGKALNKLSWITEWEKGQPIKNVETNQEFTKRVISATNKCLTYKSPVLIVSHGLFWWKLSKLLFGFHQNIENAIPYFLRPPEKPSTFWFTYPLHDT
ncbi:MAG: histidine phosphatase family protein [Rickettsia endosymbiont of Pseudomimeciton antennatum]|nr:histidine phosphatase family protein [Rickettsia endosymbiont of Pseudomimeciton antennatum]